MSKELLIKYGWRPIVSDRHAYQLQRREIKFLQKMAQRKDKISFNHYDAHKLLEIKAGNWFKLIKTSQFTSILTIKVSKD